MDKTPLSPTITETAQELRSTIGLRYYKLRLAGSSDEEAGDIILKAVHTLLPPTPSTHKS